MSWRIDVVYDVGINWNIYMKEKFSLEEIDARFYSALAEFERLISHGSLARKNPTGSVDWRKSCRLACLKFVDIRPR